MSEKTRAIFKHYPLNLFDPPFGSSLTDMIIELDFLRKKRLGGSTHPIIFFQLKSIFHILESLGSARIEGNYTTLTDYIETKISDEKTKSESEKEIANIEEALNYIDENVQSIKVDRMFISDLHKQIVKGLDYKKEGSRNPGEYRKLNLSIARSKHKPPDYTQVNQYMEEFYSFLDKNDPPKYDLLKIALAHHRFVWIHPFDNGNGRTVRLLTYAMLVKSGFDVKQGGRLINPTAVFCSDRENYHHALSRADEGKNKGLMYWCEYVLNGLKTEIEKLDKLTDKDYLQSKILLPAIHFSKERKVITDEEHKVLTVAIKKQQFQASDIKAIFPHKHASEISRIIKKMKRNKMITSVGEGARKYILRFSNNYLLRGVIKKMDEEGFLPIKD